MAKKARKESDEDAEHGIDRATGENMNAAFGACGHGIPDDVDCIDCRTNSCSGGSDCDCGIVKNGRRLRA